MYIRCDKLVNIAPVQFYESKELYLDGATKILSLNANARTLGSETLSSEIRVSYLLTIRAIYLGEDGVIECKEESYELANSLRGSYGNAASISVDTSVIGIEHHGESKVKVRVMLEQKGYAVLNSGFTPVDDATLMVKTNHGATNFVKPFTGREIIISNTQTIKQSLGKILSSDAVICVKKVSTATDICEIEGIVNIYLNYLKEGAVKGETLSFNFREELLEEGVAGGDGVSVSVKPISVTISVTESDDGSEVETQVLASTTGYATEKQEFDYPVDAYSKESELKLKVADAFVTEELCNESVEERFSETIPLEGISDAVEILSVGAPWVGASSVSANPDLMLEGVICAEILLLRDEGEVARVLAEVPYSVKLREKVECSNDLDAMVKVLSIGARLRFGSSIEIGCELLLQVKGTTEKPIRYLESAEVVGERIKNDAVISVYLVGEGETLFDCAKALGSDEEELALLNPELGLPLKAGDKVLLYRPF